MKNMKTKLIAGLAALSILAVPATVMASGSNVKQAARSVSKPVVATYKRSATKSAAKTAKAVTKSTTTTTSPVTEPAVTNPTPDTNAGSATTYVCPVAGCTADGNHTHANGHSGHDHNGTGGHHSAAPSL